MGEYYYPGDGQVYTIPDSEAARYPELQQLSPDEGGSSGGGGSAGVGQQLSQLISTGLTGYQAGVQLGLWGGSGTAAIGSGTAAAGGTAITGGSGAAVAAQATGTGAAATGTGAAATGTGAAATGTSAAGGTGAAAGVGAAAGWVALAAVASYFVDQGIHESRKISKAPRDELDNEDIIQMYQTWTNPNAALAYGADAVFGGDSKVVQTLGKLDPLNYMTAPLMVADAFGIDITDLSFGSGKGEDQRKRDAYRGNIQDFGIIDDDYILEFNGKKFDFGAEDLDGLIGDIAPDQLLNGAGATPDNKGFNINWDSPNFDENLVGAINPLAFISTGGDEKMQSDFVGQFYNAAMASGDPYGFVDNLYNKYYDGGLGRDGIAEVIYGQGEAQGIDRSILDAYVSGVDVNTKSQEGRPDPRPANQEGSQQPQQPQQQQQQPQTSSPQQDLLNGRGEFSPNNSGRTHIGQKLLSGNPIYWRDD